MIDEKNSGTNLPGLRSTSTAATGMEYEFLFITKRGGLANKTSPTSRPRRC